MRTMGPHEVGYVRDFSEQVEVFSLHWRGALVKVSLMLDSDKLTFSSNFRKYHSPMQSL